MTKGIFTISLDLELYWGVFPRLRLEEYQANLDGTRAAITATLELFEEYGIHATWATVGFLFNSDKEEFERNKPDNLPTYSNRSYDPYAISLLSNYTTSSNGYLFGSDIINEIMQYDYQEIGTHTYSHYFCLEEGQGKEQFESDIKKAVEVAKAKGIEMQSIVFPRNQVNQTYLDICRANGINCIRINPDAGIYKARRREEESKSIRAQRLIDAYVSLSDNVSDIGKAGGMTLLKASRFLRPYSVKFSFADALRLSRIKGEMDKAATSGRCYHLWWHPHNFGVHTEENISFLRKILEHYKTLESKHSFMSLNMAESSNYISNSN